MSHSLRNEQPRGVCHHGPVLPILPCHILQFWWGRLVLNALGTSTRLCSQNDILDVHIYIARSPGDITQEIAAVHPEANHVNDVPFGMYLIGIAIVILLVCNLGLFCFNMFTQNARSRRGPDIEKGDVCDPKHHGVAFVYK